MPAWVLQALTAARKVPWRKVLAAIVWLSTQGRQYWDRLTPDERREVRDLALKSKGKRSNLSNTEQDRLVVLFRAVGVPYKSGNEGMTSVMSGNVNATSEASIVVLEQVRAGKLKAIATTYDTRITSANTIPTTKEQGFPGVKIGHWAGLFAPKDTPKAILEKMNAELLAVVKSKEFHDKLVPHGIEPAPYTLPAYVAFMTAERERLGRIARAAKMQAD